MKRKTKYIIAIVLLGLLAGRAALNFSGLCSFSSGWHSDQQLIDAAVAYELNVLKKLNRRIENNDLPRDFPLKEWTPGDPNPLYLYKSVEHFHSVNPDCCDFAQFIYAEWNQQVQHYSDYIFDFIMIGVFGFSNNEVYIRYRKYNAGETQFATSKVSVSVCGHAGADRSSGGAEYPSLRGL